MARDQVAVMRALDFERFFVCGHDRGGRVAYRMALDYPDRVLGLAVLDIVPTWEAFSRADMAFGLGYWHWFYLAQPYDLPEWLIGTDPTYFFLSHPERSAVFALEALEEYLRCFRDPRTVHAICEDYRAAATLDFAHDEADRREEKRITCPMLALWGPAGQPGRVVRLRRDLAGVGRRRARPGAGVRALPAGGGSGRDLLRAANLLQAGSVGQLVDG
jgi:haloacetate dehalogenase